MTISPQVDAAIVWDAEGNSQWWFNPVNWNVAMNANTVLPPSNNAAGTSVNDTQINIGTGAWDMGSGVVYDPTNDPFFGAAAAITFPTGFNRQTIEKFYMSRNTPNTNRLTIRGDLTFLERINVGRSSGTRGVGTQAIIIQESGNVLQTVREMDLGQVDTSNPGYGHGTYDYRSGTLNISSTGGNGLRLSNGSNSIGVDLLKVGPGGNGKFVVHNPATPGFVRAKSVTASAFAGFQEGILADGSDSVFDAMFDPDGVNTGVAIFEFHYANSGTRAVQVREGMSINNGVDQVTRGIRSTRLDLVLDAPGCGGNGCVPNNVGLFDIDFDGNGFGLLGAGDLNGNGIYNDDRVFSNIDNTAAYREGDMVSAVFGSTQYNWTITYSGNISWTNPATSEVNQILGPGNGIDIVLIGHSSESLGTPGDFDGDGDVDGRDFLAWQRGNSPSPFSGADLATWQGAYNGGALAALNAVPEPTSLVLFGAILLPLLGRRRAG
ncbi:MAG: PEP-CTERM sorting domain-containing protein [Bythopirellula sp.]|nr:PEP-CTERM sorting domain-containing protein [Bythopirellula sp.]